jgi:hypothetical protein
MSSVEKAAANWASGLGLSRADRDQAASALTLHYAKPGLKGFFAVNYQVDQGVKERVRVDFILLDGSSRSPELARELLGTYRISALQDALDAALKCDGRAS